MSSFLQKHYREFYLLLPVLFGLALGHLAATALGIWLSPTVLPADAIVRERPAPAKPPTLSEYEVVLQRNIFDSTSRNVGSLGSEESIAGVPAAPARRTDLSLFGTVARGDDSLAVIKSDQGVKTYHLGDEVPGGGKIETIARNAVQIRHADGSLQNLTLYDGTPSAAAPPRTAAPAGKTAGPAGEGIRPLGENRWAIPAQMAEQARGNINELLKQARVEPNIVNGKTEGFVVRMIQPRSLLAGLGIQRGDILMQVNGVALDGPEKALQIFQQLREAKNLTISLVRNGSNLNFQYEVN